MNILEIPNWLLLGHQKLDSVIDSMPIILAKGNRFCVAKITKVVADKSYCASKKIWYHGVKLHCLGVSNPKKLPIPIVIEFSKASENDNTVFKETIAPKYLNLRIYGDKTYNDEGV
ncbi:MAG: transposase [Aureispira sp.]|nr:transposase [Aureispira sp.]